MSLPALLPMLGAPAAAFAAGLAFGLAYFAALRRTASLYATGAGWRAPALLTLGRIAAAAVFFAVAAQFGMAGLLAAFIGFLAARGVALRAARKTA